MLIPIVPVVPHTTVINKTIEYSDTVLPLNDSGKDLQVNSISNVSEYSLEECLKKIFESNPDIIFNTIQYSRKDNKVYFDGVDYVDMTGTGFLTGIDYSLKVGDLVIIDTDFIYDEDDLEYLNHATNLWTYFEQRYQEEKFMKDKKIGNYV